MSSFKKKKEKEELRKKNKALNKAAALKEKQLMSQEKVNVRSTRETFLSWLAECGRDLGTFSYSKSETVLSCNGSDGPTIKKDSIGGIPFNKPESLDRWLEKEGLYEPFDSEWVLYNNPPIVRYIDWFNKNFSN